MFAATHLVPLFPTYVWVHDLEPADHQRVNRELREAIEGVLKPRGSAKPQAGWQTRQDLHTLAEFQTLHGYIIEAVKGVLAFLEVIHEGFVITGCWANVNPPGAGHQGHTHPNNFLSGVYYVQVPSSHDGIVFQDPRPQANILSPRTRRLTEANSLNAHVPVQEGRILLFPAWFGHSVRANEGTGNRVSLAFNVMLRRFEETISPPKWAADPPTHSR